VPLSATKDDHTLSEGPIACNATLGAGEPAAVADDALAWAEQGFGTFKLKLGAGDDIGQARAVREALGPAARIRVDANAAWDVEAAARTLAELEQFGVELAEQPVATLEEMAAVAARAAIPLAADESVESRADAERAIAAGACRYTGIKLSKVGGPEEALEIAATLPAYVSSALDGPVGIAAGAAVAAAIDTADGPGLAHGLATQLLFAETVAAVECQLRDGMLHLPVGTGLGVEIDEDALSAHRLD
jgi:o-succinylbenzoate synthase